jgi:hypothetical protein
MTRPVISWSFSRLNDFRSCPYKYWRVHVRKDVGDANANNVRGEDYHKEFEMYVARGKPLPPHLVKYAPVLDKLKRQPGQQGTEVSLTLDTNYAPCAWNDWDRAWVRSKVDWQLINGTKAWLWDYKFGKAKKDQDDLGGQNALNAVLLMHHYPNVEAVHTTYYFALHDKLESSYYPRSLLPQIWGKFLPDVNKLAQAKVKDEWPKQESPLCGWCPVMDCQFNTMLQRLARENASKEPE